MITSSIVLYNTDHLMVQKIIKCVDDSCINRIYVIDNSSTNQISSYVKSLSSKVDYIFGQGNIGYGAGHNIGLRKALNDGSRYHVVLNPDIQFEKGTIETLIQFADIHNDIGMLMPRVVYPDGREQYLCKLLPSPIDMFGRRLLPNRLISKRNYRYEMRATGYNDIRNVPCLSGCFMFLNMKIIRTVGLFDDRYFMYFEDFDLIRRIHKVSKTVFYPMITIVHNHATEHRRNKTLLKISIKSAIKYFNKWGWLFDCERKEWNTCAFDQDNIIK